MVFCGCLQLHSTACEILLLIQEVDSSYNQRNYLYETENGTNLQSRLPLKSISAFRMNNLRRDEAKTCSFLTSKKFSLDSDMNVPRLGTFLE